MAAPGHDGSEFRALSGNRGAKGDEALREGCREVGAPQ
jgi:hypothetical protein